MAIDTDALLVSEKGRPLLVTGARRAVKKVSMDLGILTYEGRTPPPHRYRHSLGTLNCGALGMKIPPKLLTRRYRHRDERTTWDIYVANNSLLDEAQHEALVAANGNGHAASLPPDVASMATDMTVPESEARVKVRALEVAWKSLRRHAFNEMAAVQRGCKVYYSSSFLERLCKEWMTKKEAMRLLNLTSQSGYFSRVRAEGMRTLVIGRASLVRVEDVMSALRRLDDADSV